MITTARSRVLGLLVLALCSAAASSARAAVESELVQRGTAAFEALDYPAAVQLLNEALHESLTREEKQVAYRTLGMAHAAMGEPEAARQSFQELLRSDPNAELDRTVAPKIRSIFEEARAALAQIEAPTVAATLPRLQPRVEPPAPLKGQGLSIEVSYGGGVARKLSLFHRARGARAFSLLEAAGDAAGHFRIEVPGPAVRPPAFEYYLVLLDEHGAGVAGAGALGSPLVVDVKARPRPLVRRGWFWGVVVGSAAAVGLATALALTLPDALRSSDATLTLHVR